MDAHYGDGVVEYFENDSDVLTISVHQEDLWPRTGLYKYDTINNTINLPVKAGFNDQKFYQLLSKES